MVNIPCLRWWETMLFISHLCFVLHPRSKVCCNFEKGDGIRDGKMYDRNIQKLDHIHSSVTRVKWGIQSVSITMMIVLKKKLTILRLMIKSVKVCRRKWRYRFGVKAGCGEKDIRNVENKFLGRYKRLKLWYFVWHFLRISKNPKKRQNLGCCYKNKCVIKK